MDLIVIIFWRDERECTAILILMYDSPSVKCQTIPRSDALGTSLSTALVVTTDKWDLDFTHLVIHCFSHSRGVRCGHTSSKCTKGFIEWPGDRVPTIVILSMPTGQYTVCSQWWIKERCVSYLLVSERLGGWFLRGLIMFFWRDSWLTISPVIWRQKPCWVIEWQI